MKEEKHFCGTTCANPEVNGNTADAAWKQVPMYKPSLCTRFIWWLQNFIGKSNYFYNVEKLYIDYT